jgi:hypothetical protein
MSFQTLNNTSVAPLQAFRLCTPLVENTKGSFDKVIHLLAFDEVMHQIFFCKVIIAIIFIIFIVFDEVIL